MALIFPFFELKPKKAEKMLSLLQEGSDFYFRLCSPNYYNYGTTNFFCQLPLHSGIRFLLQCACCSVGAFQEPTV